MYKISTSDSGVVLDVFDDQIYLDESVETYAITDAEFEMIRASGDHNKWRLVDGVIRSVEPTTEELAAAARSQRNALLAATDWSQAADVPQATKDLWAPYRQALRAVPEQSGFPTDIQWPVKPA